MDAKKKRNRKKKSNQGKNTDDTASNAEEVVGQDLNHDSAIQQNHNEEISANADAQSVGVSESDMDLEKQKTHEARLVELYEIVKRSEGERNSLLQQVINLEGKLEGLQNKVHSSFQNEVLLEEKLNNLQNGYESLVKEEVILEDKLKRVEGIEDSWIQKEASLKEKISELEEVNKALQMQVKGIEQSTSSIVQEHQRLISSLSILESKMWTLEARVDRHEISAGNILKVNEQDNEAVQSASAAEPAMRYNLNQVKDLVGTYTPDHVHEHVEKTSESNETIHPSGRIPEILDGGAILEENLELDKPRISEEIVSVPLDEIEIHEEEEPQGAMNTEKPEEIPLSDAPLIGAPFRLFSFVTKYVSGADLVNESTSKSGR